MEACIRTLAQPIYILQIVIHRGVNFYTSISYIPTRSHTKASDLVVSRKSVKEKLLQICMKTALSLVQKNHDYGDTREKSVILFSIFETYCSLNWSGR